MTRVKCGRWSQWLRRSSLSISTAGLVSVLAVPAALANEELARSGARETARSGVEAFEQKRYSEALDLFTRAESVVHAPTHLLYIARSAVELRRLILARETYLKLTHEQLPPNASSAFRAAQKTAADELATLEPRIPKLKLDLRGSSTNAAQVSLDGQVLPSALIGASIPIDPGRHRINASAPGMRPIEVEVNIEESSEQVAVLNLEAETAKASTDVSPTSVASPHPTSPDGTAPHHTNYLRIGAFAAAGVGVVGLGVGTYFVFRAKSKTNDANDLYAANACPSGASCTAARRDEIINLDNDAASAKTASAVGFITGGVGVAAAVTLFVLSTRRTEPSSTATSLVPYASPRDVGVIGWF